MKYLFGFVFTFILLNGINGQGIISSGAINGDGNITIIQSASSTDGDIYVFGHFTGSIDFPSNLGTSIGGRDYFIAKIDSTLEVQWFNQIASPVNVYVYGGITVDANNDVYVTGGFRNYIRVSDTDSIFSSGAFDTFLAKYDDTGTPLWIKQVGQGGRNERPNSLSVDLAGNLLMGGFFSDSIEFDENLTFYNDDSTDDYYYGKFDPTTGDRIWARQILGINNTLSGRLFDIVATPEAYYMTGPYADSIGFGNDTIESLNNNYDVHLIKTDLDGNIEWVRSFKGDLADNSWSLTSDDNNNVYVAGWYDTPAGLIVDSTETEVLTFSGSDGDENLNVFIVKYDEQGTLQWVRAGDRANHGGSSDEKVFDIEIFSGQLNVCGYYENEFTWGANTLTSYGPGDFNMFVASMTLDGDYRSAISYSREETKNGYEASRSLFKRGDDLYVVIESTSTRLVYEDDIYDNLDGLLMVAILEIGCLPLTIENTVVTDVEGCHGDSTGSILIVVSTDSPGWGAPYQYSIDNGNNYQASPLFDSLPAGTYYPVIYDSRECTFAGDPIVINEPDSILIDSAPENVRCFAGNSGSISINIAGGVPPFQYSADGGSSFQAAATFAALTAGEYQIQVLDSDDCLAIGDTIEITQPESALAIDTVSTSNITDSHNGEIVVTASGGTAPYTYSINPSAGTQNPDSVFTFAAEEDNNYNVQVEDANGCTASTSTITISDLTNIPSLDILNASIYPNPSSGMITLEFNTEKAEMTMEVFSIDGRNVMSRQVYSAGGQVKETLDLSGLDKGMYMIRMDQQTLSSAVVIN